jgi:hypothetical protein
VIKPISPKEIGAYKAKVFPDFVLESVNELIAENFTNGRAVVLQKDIVTRITSKMDGDSYDMKRKMVYDKGWLNFEEIYGDAGWSVVYDKPAYNESYDATFEFKVKK